CGDHGIGLCFHPKRDIQQQCCRQDGSQRVGHSLSGNIVGGAVDGLVHAGAVADGGGGQHAHGAGDLGGFVGEDIAEKIGGDHHVKAAGIFDEQHGGSIHELVFQ